LFDNFVLKGVEDVCMKRFSTLAGFIFVIVYFSTSVLAQEQARRVCRRVVFIK